MTYSNHVETNQQDNAILAPGTLVNGYQIIREIGHGSTAVVYLAKQLDLGRNVALKVLSAELSQNAEYVSRFINEARAAATLSHQNIIQAFDAGVAPGNIYFFCMEYVDGDSLMLKIPRNGALPPPVFRLRPRTGPARRGTSSAPAPGSPLSRFSTPSRSVAAGYQRFLYMSS